MSYDISYRFMSRIPDGQYRNLIAIDETIKDSYKKEYHNMEKVVNSMEQDKEGSIEEINASEIRSVKSTSGYQKVDRCLNNIMRILNHCKDLWS